MMKIFNLADRKPAKGLTLVELVGIVMILGIVACVVLPRLRQRNTARPVAPPPVVESVEETTQDSVPAQPTE